MSDEYSTRVLAQQARTDNPDLLMSGYPEKVLKQDSENQQHLAVLEKPHSLEQLARALQNSLTANRRCPSQPADATSTTGSAAALCVSGSKVVFRSAKSP